MTTEFAYQDFLLVDAPQIVVLDAVAAMLDEADRHIRAAAGHAAGPAGGHARARPARRAGEHVLGGPIGEGVTEDGASETARPGPIREAVAAALGQILGREPSDRAAVEEGPEILPFTLFVDEDLASRRPIVWNRAGPPAGIGDVIPALRVSCPAPSIDEERRRSRLEPMRGEPLGGRGSSWTLVELAAPGTALAEAGKALSSHLYGHDVLAFRRSGGLTRTPEFAFHLMRGGRQLRRVLSRRHEPQSAPDRAWWEGIAEGAMTRFEARSFYEEATEASLMTREIQEAILARIGFRPGMLLVPEGRRRGVLFARRRGGAPISLLRGAEADAEAAGRAF